MASAGLVLAALHAGYKLPSAPSSTATPKPNRTSSGVRVTEIAVDAEVGMDMPSDDIALVTAWVGCGSSRLARDDALNTPIATPTMPAIKLSMIPSSMN